MSEKWKWDDNDDGEVYLYRNEQERENGLVEPFTVPDIISAFNSYEDKVTDLTARVMELEVAAETIRQPDLDKLARCKKAVRVILDCCTSAAPNWPLGQRLADIEAEANELAALLKELP